MTISRSEPLDVHRVQWRFISSALPEAAIVAIHWKGAPILEVAMSSQAEVRVHFPRNAEPIGLPIQDLRNLLTQCESELGEWWDRIRSEEA